MYRPATLLFLLGMIFTTLCAQNTEDNQSLYSFDQCRGSGSPYPAPEARVALPDSLTLIMINHVGRHGSRYETSPRRANAVKKALNKAKKNGTLTPSGEKMLALTQRVINLSEGKWGQLDSIGMAEHRGIALRLCKAWPGLLEGARIEAISSYVPRCIMSMDEFTHQITLCNDKVNILYSSGPVNSPLLRPFAIDSAYIYLRDNAPWEDALNKYCDNQIPLAPIERLIGKDALDKNAMRALATNLYGMLAGLNASGISQSSLSEFYTLEEANEMWRCRNLTQYLQRTTSVYSSLPSDIASTLLADIVATTDDFIAGRSSACISLRFGHAETLMPLLALTRIPQCYYVNSNLSSVDRHWMNFHVTPMATNLQMLVTKAPSGTIYVRLDLNERPVHFPGTSQYYVTWAYAHKYFDQILSKASWHK